MVVMDTPRPLSSDPQSADRDATDQDGVFVVVDAGADGGPSRFELHRDGALVGWASYRREGRSIVIPHVETLVQHRGQGFADRLMAGIVDIARRSDDRLAPLCSFAAGYLRDHPEHEDLVEWPRGR